MVESSVIRNVRLMNNGLNKVLPNKLVSNNKIGSFIRQNSRLSIKTSYSGVVTSIAQNTSGITTNKTIDLLNDASNFIDKIHNQTINSFLIQIPRIQTQISVGNLLRIPMPLHNSFNNN